MKARIRVYGRNVVFKAHQFPVAVERYDLDGTHEPHGHDFLEIALIGSGSCSHQTVYGTKPLRTGHVIIVRPGEWHAYTDCRALAVTNCYVGAELLGRELAWTQSDHAMSPLFGTVRHKGEPAGPHALLLSPPMRRRAEEAMEALRVAITRRTAGHDAAVLGTLLLMCAAIADATRRAPAPPASPHHAVEKGAQLLRERMDEPWSLAMLSRELHGISEAYFVRLFTAHIGAPPMQFLTRLRAERAAALLVRTSEPVALIGGQVGWDDPNYFSRRFRTVFGVSPAEYRQRFRLT